MKTLAKFRKNSILFFILTFMVLAVIAVLPFSTKTKAVNPPPNILIILTDDQRVDTMWAMPKTREILGSIGVTFTDASVSTPLCCPSRTGFFSGGYFTRNTGILNNLFPNGGAVKFGEVDNKALPGRLQKSGYQTGLFGKYLNEYPSVQTKSPDEPWPYIPPGWSSFTISSESNSPKNWFTFPIVKGTSLPFTAKKGAKSTITNTYINDYFTGELLSFVEKSKTEGNPFFAMLSTHGPHGPSYYPAEDEGKFEDYVHNPPSFSEADLSDKPQYVRDEMLEFNATKNTEVYRNMLRSLQPIDRSVEKIMQKLTELDLLSNTLVVFTADNGYMWGEHYLTAKGVPYEESIRVPLIVYYPGARNGVTDNSFVYANLDLAATVQELAGIFPKTDGKSLVPLLLDENTSWRNEIYSEWFKGGSNGNTSSWSLVKQRAINGKEFKLVEYQSGEKEFYSLSDDRYELENKIFDPKYATRIKSLSEKLAQKKGLSISFSNTTSGILPTAKVGVPYYFKFEAWGSKKPYTWSITSVLPAGLVLNTDTGELTGTPTESTLDLVPIDIKVVGSSKATYAEKMQEFTTKFRIAVDPATTFGSTKTYTPTTQESKKVKLEMEDEVWKMDEN